MTIIRAALCGTSLIVLTLAPPEARADERAEAALRAAIARIDASPAWKASAEGIRSDDAAAVADLLKIKAENGTAELSIVSLRFDGLRAVNSGFAFDSLSAQGLGGSFEGGEFRIPELSARTAFLPGLEDVVIDDKAPLASFGRLLTGLSNARFSAIDVPHIWTRTGSAKSHINSEIKLLRLESMASGKLARLSFASYKVRQSVLEGPVVPFQTGAGEVTGFDLGALAAVLDPSSYRQGKGDGVWRPLLDSMGMSDARADNGRLTMKHLGVTGLQVRQTAEPPTTLYDAIAALDPPALHEDEIFALLDRRATDMLGWLRMGQFRIEGIDARPKSGGLFTAAAFSIDNVSPDGIKRAALEKVGFVGPQMSGGLLLAAMEDVQWPTTRSLLAAARLGQAGDKGLIPEDAELEAIAANFFDILPRIARFDIRGFEAGALGQPPVSLGHYGWQAEGPLAFPTHAVSEARDIVIPGAYLRLDPQSAALFDALGYDQLKIAFDQTTHNDPESGSYSNGMALGVENAGRLSFDFEADGVTRAALNRFMFLSLKSEGRDPSIAEIKSAFAGFTLKSMRLRFEDQSLTGRLVPYLAKQQGVGEDAFKANYVAMMQIGLAALGNPALTTAAANAFKTYLDQPRSLTFSVKPGKPLGFAEFEAMNPDDPAAIADKLGISITAND